MDLGGYEGTGGRRKLYDEELYDLQSSPNIIRVLKSRKMRWVGSGGGGGVWSYGPYLL